MGKKQLLKLLSALIIISRFISGAHFAESAYNFQKMWPEKQWAFYDPSGVAVDNSGNIFIIDYGNHCVKKYDVNGNLLLQWGSQGEGDYEFMQPNGLAIDSTGNVYIADSGLCAIKKYSSTGSFITKWGQRGYNDGEFSGPAYIAIGPSGTLYISEYQRIEKYAQDGTYLGRVNINLSTQFMPGFLAVNDKEEIYVLNWFNLKLQKFSADGTLLLEWSSSDPESYASFYYAHGIALDESGNVYVTESGVRHDYVVKFDPSGVFISKWGTSGVADGQFLTAYAIASDKNGKIYVACREDNNTYFDAGNSCIQVFSTTGSFLSKWGRSGFNDGYFWNPSGITTDSQGNIYVADASNDRIQKFDSQGNFLAKWGAHGSQNGAFGLPSMLCIDKADNLYVLDAGNDRIQKFSSDGTFITTWDILSYNNQVSYATMAIDILDEIYVFYQPSSMGADNTITVQKFNSDGALILSWQTTGTGLEFYPYCSPTIDLLGNIYLTDGTNVYQYSADGNRLSSWALYNEDLTVPVSPYGSVTARPAIAIDNLNNLYVLQFCRLQKYTTSGTLLEQFGTYGSNSGQFNYAVGFSIDNAGNLYVADTHNHRIQKFTGGQNVSQTVNTGDVKIVGGEKGYINLSKGEKAFIYFLPTETGTVTIKIFNIIGDLIYEISKDVTGNIQQVIPWDAKNNNGQKVASGVYLIHLEGCGINTTKKMAIVK